MYEQIIAAYPELKDTPEAFWNGTIKLQNDTDGKGDYVKEWNYDKPLPEGMKIGK